MSELTVTTFNLGHGKTRAGIISLERAARLLKDSGAGLVALQEVDRFWPRSYFEDQAAILGRRLSMHHLFVPLPPTLDLPGHLGRGVAFLSRYPFTHHTFHRLARGKTVLQRAAIDFGGRRVTCLNVTLKASPEAWRGIRDICRELRPPAVLAVDASPPGAGLPLPGWRNAVPALDGESLKTPLRHARPQGSIFFSPHWDLRSSLVHRTNWSADWAVTAVAELRVEPGKIPTADPPGG